MSNDFGLGNPGRREAAVAVAVACLLVLVSWIASHAAGDPEPAGRSTLASSPDESLVKLDVSPVVTPEEIKGCLAKGFARKVDDVEVLYSRIQKSEQGNVPVLVLRNQRGELRLCDSFGGTAPSQLPVPSADEGNPVVFLSNSRQSWDCDGDRLAGFEESHWLSVGALVDRVDLRFLVNGSAGPWFSAEAADGYAHVHAWLSEQNAGAAVAVQIRVLSADGEVLPQDTIPTEPSAVTGCDGRDIDLG